MVSGQRVTKTRNNDAVPLQTGEQQPRYMDKLIELAKDCSLATSTRANAQQPAENWLFMNLLQ